MKILLITPPLLQPNTPYAATPILCAWLKSIGHDAVQADLSLELLLKLCTTDGTRAIASQLDIPARVAERYAETVEDVIEFLQDRNPQSASKLAVRGFLPEGPALADAYEQDDQLGWDFRGLDDYDRARHLSSLYLDDLADMAAELDPSFGFSRYAEKLAGSLPEFEPLKHTLECSDSIFMDWLEQLTDQTLALHSPEMVALTVPFPGCLTGALTIARRIKQIAPSIHVTLGGGYVNTELRELTDTGIFDYVDTLTFDSGFLPLKALAETRDPSGWVRTMRCADGQVVYHDSGPCEVDHAQLPAPDYTGLDLHQYFGMFEVLNPVTRLWSDGRWNKLTLAHGCCWSRCAFCDTTIDYIGRYDPADPVTICDWIETVMAETGFNGFHFVDEALPPDLLDGLSDEILKRGLQIEWWGNIRFEKRFSEQLIYKMAEAGCIAVTGGLETCCDRTLKLMRKGITVQHATRVLSDLAHAGIMTHAYLMYGFPTQTEDETFQALETVRQLFDAGILHSAYWHRFALTAHSPIARNPEQYKIKLLEPVAASFAVNEIPFSGRFNYDLDHTGRALKAAAYNYQLGIGLDIHVQKWNEIARSE